MSRVMMEVVDRDDIDVKAEITLPLHQWRELKELLTKEERLFGGLGDIRDSVINVVCQIEKRYYSQEDE